MFESARLKVARAQRHLHELRKGFDAFVAEKPHRFGVKHDLKTGQAFVQIRFVLPIPPAFSVVIGDCIHNLRSALDHLMWELIGIDGGKQHDHLHFVIRDDRSNYEGTCNAIDTPSRWVKDLLINYEAFKDGEGGIFHAINFLDNADKHRVVMPVLRATGHPPFEVFHADGRPQASMYRNKYIGNWEGEIAIAQIPPGGHVELHDDAECTPDIFLPEVPDANVKDFLNRCGHSVVTAINEAEAAVSKNKA